MARQYYDDGSYIDTMENGDTIGYNTAGVPVNKVEADGDYFQSPGYWNDAREAEKLDAYVPRPNGDTRPWYERVAEYGLTRAIDSNFGAPATNKTGAGGSFAGQNGKTYSTTPGGTVNGGGASMPWLPIALAAAAAFFVLG